MKKVEILNLLDSSKIIVKNPITKKIFSFLQHLTRRQEGFFGLYEAFDISVIMGIDWWCRHRDCSQVVRKYGCRSVLDVGGERGDLLRFLGEGISFLTLNKRREVLIGIDGVLGDACNLPFRTKSFNGVVSLQTYPQIPPEMRTKFLSELQRVGRMFILHTPAQSSDGLYRGEEYGYKFQYIRRLIGIEWSYNGKLGVTLEELKEALPTAKYIGRKNCDVWLKYMTFAHIPLTSLLAGLIYSMHWQKMDNKPPFYEVMVIEEKRR